VTVQSTAHDGRVLRGERTRHALITALLALIEDGIAEPTAREVADRAGVGLRTVYQHFDDVEALFAHATAVHLERIAAFRAPAVTGGSRDERIEAIVRARTTLYERIAPVRRAALRASVRSPTLSLLLDASDDQFADETERVFDRDLRSMPRARRTEVAAQLDLALSFAAWEHLRIRRRRSVSAVRALLSAQLRAILAPMA
jgi:TetR/AcrR family transcriptional regulator, regulator of autoinduction and epiphytic fitness